MIEFTVPGLHGKDRPRMTKGGHVYTAKATEDFEDKVQWHFRRAVHGPIVPLEGPVSVTIKAYHPTPKSAPKRTILQMLAAILRPLVKPDIDNVIKLVLDALNGLGYKDDKQVVELHAYKFYMEGGGATYVRVEAVARPEKEA